MAAGVPVEPILSFGAGSEVVCFGRFARGEAGREGGS